MSLKNLRTLIPQQQQQQPELTKLHHRLKGLTFEQFWDLNPPTKAGVKQPIYSYQKTILDTLFLEEQGPNSFKNKHLWLKKTVGAGLSTLIGYVILWLVTRDNATANTDVIIFTGASIDLAITQIEKLKSWFNAFDIKFTDRSTTLRLNGVTIRAYPANHTSRARGLIPSFIFLDEAGAWNLKEGYEAEIVASRYISKTNANPFIVICSTAFASRGMFYDIEMQPESECLYRKIFLPWWKCTGNGLMFSMADIERARKIGHDTFRREYEGAYNYGIGDLLPGEIIDQAIEDYDVSKFDLQNSVISCGCDVAWGGTSKFSLTTCGIFNDKIYVLDNLEYSRLSVPAAVEITIDLLTKYGWSNYSDNVRVFVDQNAPEFIRQLKLAVDENEKYEDVVKYANDNSIDLGSLMRILPIGFGSKGAQMISHLRSLFYDGGVRISPRHRNLITELRIARVSNISGNLLKESSGGESTFDNLDSLRLALLNIKENTNR